MSALSKVTGRGVLLAKKFTPEILTGAGVVGVVGTVVLSSRATLKLESVIETLETRKDDINLEMLDQKITKEEGQKKLFIAHREFVVSLIKLYAPSATLGILSISALLGAHGVMKKRNVALVGAYKSLETAYDTYRERVRAEVGEEKEREIRLDLRALNEAESAADGDDKPMALLSDEELKKQVTGASKYARFFDEYSKDFVRNHDYNRAFLTSKQDYLNDLLQTRGHVTLNDVYDALGFERIKEGQVVGWVYGPQGKDNVIDFNIFALENKRFVNGDEYSLLLDFNVDGYIFDKI